MQPPESLLGANFDDREEELAQKLLKNKYISLVENAGPDGSNAIQVSYQGYERGSKRVIVSSILPRPLKEATLCYKVRFANDFQFVLGGKLHGLGPQRPITGGEDMRPDGWSARIMWKEKGSLRTYIYHQDKPTKWGQGKMADGFYFQPGRWYSVSIQVRVNSEADVADGFTHVYVDGQQVVAHDNLRLRGVGGDRALISQLLFNTFHGGNQPKWAPTLADGSYATVTADFDDIAVYEGAFVTPAVFTLRRVKAARDGLVIMLFFLLVCGACFEVLSILKKIRKNSTFQK
jgi:hypothetical protein